MKLFQLLTFSIMPVTLIVVFYEYTYVLKVSRGSKFIIFIQVKAFLLNSFVNRKSIKT